jgi:hypothetical protein
VWRAYLGQLFEDDGSGLGGVDVNEPAQLLQQSRAILALESLAPLLDPLVVFPLLLLVE